MATSWDAPCRKDGVARDVPGTYPPATDLLSERQQKVRILLVFCDSRAAVLSVAMGCSA